MPASSIDCYLQGARNNFDAVRPAPIPADANVLLGQCQNNIHISTNCYYGYDPKITRNISTSTDCEMLEVAESKAVASPQTTARKRGADFADFPQNKRLRQEVQRETNNEPETNETKRSDKGGEDLMESLYWNTHGGNMFHLIQCL